MTEILLSSYTFSIRHRNPQRGHSSNGIDLSNIPILSNGDLLDVIRNILKEFRDNYRKDDSDRTTLGVEKIEVSKRAIAGLLSFGKYGFSSRIYDTQKSMVSYHKKDFEAEVLPFYYLIFVPQPGTQGLLFLQRTGQFGVADEFKSRLTKAIHSKLGDKYIVAITPVVPASVAKDILKRGQVKKIRYTAFKIPPDIADAINHHVVSEDFNVELVLSARRGGAFKIKQALLKHLSDDKDFLVSFLEGETLPRNDTSQSLPPNNVKLEVALEGSNRVINLSELGNTNPYYNITRRITFDETGNAEYDSIHKVAIEMLYEFAKMLGLSHE